MSRPGKSRVDVGRTELDEDDVLFPSLDGNDSSDKPCVDVHLENPTPDAIMDGNSLKSGCRVAKLRLDVGSTELDEDDVLFASLDGYDSSDNPRVDVDLKPPTPDDIMDGNSLNSGRCVVDAIIIDDSDSESSDHCT